MLKVKLFAFAVEDARAGMDVSRDRYLGTMGFLVRLETLCAEARPCATPVQPLER